MHRRHHVLRVDVKDGGVPGDRPRPFQVEIGLRQIALADSRTSSARHRHDGRVIRGQPVGGTKGGDVGEIDLGLTGDHQGLAAAVESAGVQRRDIVDDGEIVGRNLVNAVLTLALIATAIALVFRSRIVARYADRLGGLAPQQVATLTTVVGGVLGTLVSLSSVGAGAIGVTCLLLLYPKLPAVKIVGSDIAHAVPLTLVAGLGHLLLGSFDLQVFGLLILGSVPGIVLGSYAAVRLPEPALRVVLAATLLVVAAKLSFSLLTPSANVVAVDTQGRR